MGPGCNTREIADKLIDLKLELEDLDRREHELDQQRVWVQQSIKNVTDDSLNSPYPSNFTFKSTVFVLHARLILLEVKFLLERLFAVVICSLLKV